MDNSNLKDHKQIGQELELFFTNEIAPGAPFWLPRGMTIFKELEKYIRSLTENAGYLETSTPIMVKNSLFKKSGHWDKFGGHNMYNLSLWEPEEIEEIQKIVNQITIDSNLQTEILKSAVPYVLKIDYHGEEVEVGIMNPILTPDGLVFSLNLLVNYSLKPMNCPESTVLYRFRPRSYRELPLRLSEIGRLHRREKSGEVNGLLRVRQLTMDDAHLFVTKDQILKEVSGILDMMIDFYDSFGFEYEFKLATRPETFAGTKENWEEAEKDLEEALKAKKLKYSIKEKDGAFYGPKIDMHIKDSLGREWQLATVQIDFHQPEAFKLAYIDETGTEQRPVMIHRAIFGSFERFIGILTEHFQGAFPIWLSPVQVAILPVSEKIDDFAKTVFEKIKNENIRVEHDNSNKTIGLKIREATLQKAPYMCIIGGKEMEASNKEDIFVSVRTREGKDLGVQKLSLFLSNIKQEIEKKL